MPDLFKDYVQSILKTKKDFGGDIKDYVPWVVNKALSAYGDAVLFANQMNMNSHISKKMQYEYLLHTIRGMNRQYEPYPKGVKYDDLELVKVFYSYSDRQAKQALRILTPEQLEKIRTMIPDGVLDDRKHVGSKSRK